MRKPYFTDEERHVLGVLAQPYVEIFENSSADNLSKKNTWEILSAQFNENSNIEYKRSPEHLKRCWDHLRSRFKVHLYNIGKSEVILDPSFPNEFAKWVACFGKHPDNAEKESTHDSKKTQKRKHRTVKNNHKRKLLASNKSKNLQTNINDTITNLSSGESSTVEPCEEDLSTSAEDGLRASSRLVSRPFLPSERMELVNLVRQYRSIINYKKTEQEDIKAKKRVWKIITNEFNKTAVRKRDENHVRKFWDNMKLRIRALLLKDGCNCIARMRDYELEALKIMNPGSLYSAIDVELLNNTLAERGIVMDAGDPTGSLSSLNIDLYDDNDQIMDCYEPLPVDTILEETNPLEINSENEVSIEEQLQFSDLPQTNVYLDSQIRDNSDTQESMEEFNSTIEPITIKEEPIESFMHQEEEFRPVISETYNNSTPIVFTGSLPRPTIVLNDSGGGGSDVLNAINNSISSQLTNSNGIALVDTSSSSIQIPIGGSSTTNTSTSTGVNNKVPMLFYIGSNNTQADINTPTVSLELPSEDYLDLELRHLRGQVEITKQKHALDVMRLQNEFTSMQAYHQKEIQLLQHRIAHANAQIKFCKNKRK